jgi:ABC-type antimicrobial peptide transport system permease subunit
MGDILYIYIISAIAIFVLLIACINFMNLSTARSANRAKEVGLRKVVGAMKSNLVGQFYGESILLAFIGLFLSLLIIALILPSFSTFVDKEFSLKTLLHWKFLLGMLSVTLLTGIASGSYPALFLSAFQPVKILRGGISAGSKGSLFRRVLVVVQFTLSLLLIIGTIVIYSQTKFMKSKELGFDKEHLIFVPLRGDTKQSFEVLKQEMLKDQKVVNVSGTNFYPTNIGSNSSGAEWDGKDPELRVLISFGSVDFDYIETMKIDLVEGRSFSKEFSTDTSSAFLVNEEVAKIMGKPSVVNESFSFVGKEGTIIGVMKNYHFQSVESNIEPLAINVRPENNNYMLIRLQVGDPPAAVEYVKSAWEKIVPNYPFDHEFVDQRIERMYSDWEDLSTLLKYFAFLAILIACLGLFGLASFTAEQRTKEIGVRKVLGASVHSIVMLMSKEFTKWVLVANIIACPISYFVMNNWLQSFAYRINIGIETFILSAAMALLIALLTVSYQAFKAARSNPVEALKYE